MSNPVEKISATEVNNEITSKEVCNEFTQSQGHGFVWENDIREKVFNLKKNKNDTNVHDISSEELGTTENISIKATSCDTVYCGDIIRYVFGYDFRQTHTMMIVKYRQNGDTKTITCVYEIDYTKEMNTYLFNNIKKEQLEEYIKIIKKEGRNFDYKKEARRLEKDNEIKATIHPKVDSGKQRRVQTSFKISHIERDLPHCIKYKSPSDKPNLVRNKEITLSIKSIVRARNKTKKQQTIVPKKTTRKFTNREKVKILQAQDKKDPDYIPYSRLKGNNLQNAVVSLVEKKKANIIDTINKLNNESEKPIDDKIIQSILNMKNDVKEISDVLNDTISKLESVATPDKKVSPLVKSKQSDDVISDALNETISKLESVATPDKKVSPLVKSKQSIDVISDVLNDTISKLESVATPDKKVSPLVKSKQSDDVISDALNETISKLEKMTLNIETGGKKKDM